MVKQARVDVSSITGIAFSPQYRSYQRGFFDPSFQCQVEVAVLEDLIKGGGSDQRWGNSRVQSGVS